MMRSERGFSLVELLFSVGILTTVICGILATFSSCFVLGALSKNTNTATNAGIGLIEEVRSTPFAQIYDDYDQLNFTVNGIPLSRGIVYVDDSNPELLEVTVVVCWRQGARAVGEDANLNGALDAGEDTNGNGRIDSPVEIVTRVANR
jgi:hypothetical protein